VDLLSFSFTASEYLLDNVMANFIAIIWRQK